jgi:hypothetical protein
MMEANVAPKPKRVVTFEVTEDEARNIAGFLQAAFAARINNPFREEGAQFVMQTFRDISEGKV